MNKYIEILNKIVAEINDEDCSVDFCHAGEIDLARNVELSFSHSAVNPEPFFKDIIPNLNWVEMIVIDCDTNEIELIAYFDEETQGRDPEWCEMEIRQIILDSLTADELEIYHEKCKAAIERAKKGFLNRVEREEN